jgi:hypothetical protein
VSCTRDDDGRRILRGRHADTPQPHPDNCTGCLPCPDRHCLACHRTHALDICPACQLDVRTDLALIGGMAPNLANHAAHGHPAYSVHHGIPGGDALVMAGPGTSQRTSDPAHHDELPSDPHPPLPVLQGWIELWSHLVGHQSALVPQDLDSAVAYLDRRLHTYAAHPGPYLAMSHELAALRRRIEDLTHDGERPDTSRVPCWECGTRLVKVYAAQEGRDHWCCPRCGEMYDRGRYDRAMHDHLASTGANRFVPVTDATAAIGRPVHTVRAWIRRGLVDTQRHPTTGRLMAWWPDVRHAHLTTGYGRGGTTKLRSPSQTAF